MGKDIRLAVRSMAKSPAYTAVVVLSLAFGIGADTAIFTLINAVFLPDYALRVSLVARGDPAALLGTVQREVQALDRNLLNTNPFTMSNLIGRTLWAEPYRCPDIRRHLAAAHGGCPGREPASCTPRNQHRSRCSFESGVTT